MNLTLESATAFLDVIIWYIDDARDLYNLINTCKSLREMGLLRINDLLIDPNTIPSWFAELHFRTACIYMEFKINPTNRPPFEVESWCGMCHCDDPLIHDERARVSEIEYDREREYDIGYAIRYGGARCRGYVKCQNHHDAELFLDDFDDFDDVDDHDESDYCGDVDIRNGFSCYDFAHDDMVVMS